MDLARTVASAFTSGQPVPLQLPLLVKHVKLSARYHALHTPSDFIKLLTPQVPDPVGLPVPDAAKSADVIFQVVGYELVRAGKDGPFPSECLQTFCRHICGALGESGVDGNRGNHLVLRSAMSADFLEAL